MVCSLEESCFSDRISDAGVNLGGWEKAQVGLSKIIPFVPLTEIGRLELKSSMITSSRKYMKKILDEGQDYSGAIFATGFMTVCNMDLSMTQKVTNSLIIQGQEKGNETIIFFFIG